jgi:hypothetical protein
MKFGNTFVDTTYRELSGYAPLSHLNYFSDSLYHRLNDGLLHPPSKSTVQKESKQSLFSKDFQELKLSKHIHSSSDDAEDYKNNKYLNIGYSDDEESSEDEVKSDNEIGNYKRIQPKSLLSLTKKLKEDNIFEDYDINEKRKLNDNKENLKINTFKSKKADNRNFNYDLSVDISKENKIVNKKANFSPDSSSVKQVLDKQSESSENVNSSKEGFVKSLAKIYEKNTSQNFSLFSVSKLKGENPKLSVDINKSNSTEFLPTVFKKYISNSSLNTNLSIHSPKNSPPKYLLFNSPRTLTPPKHNSHHHHHSKKTPRPFFLKYSSKSLSTTSLTPPCSSFNSHTSEKEVDSSSDGFLHITLADVYGDEDFRPNNYKQSSFSTLSNEVNLSKKSKNQSSNFNTLPSVNSASKFISNKSFSDNAHRMPPSYSLNKEFSSALECLSSNSPFFHITLLTYEKFQTYKFADHRFCLIYIYIY